MNQLTTNTKEVEEMENENENTIRNIEQLDEKINEDLATKSKRLESSVTMLNTLMKDVGVLFEDVGADRSSLTSKLGATQVSHFPVLRESALV